MTQPPAGGPGVSDGDAGGWRAPESAPARSGASRRPPPQWGQPAPPSWGTPGQSGPHGLGTDRLRQAAHRHRAAAAALGRGDPRRCVPGRAGQRAHHGRDRRGRDRGRHRALPRARGPAAQPVAGQPRAQRRVVVAGRPDRAHRRPRRVAHRLDGAHVHRRDHARGAAHRAGQRGGAGAPDGRRRDVAARPGPGPRRAGRRAAHRPRHRRSRWSPCSCPASSRSPPGRTSRA